MRVWAKGRDDSRFAGMSHTFDEAGTLAFVVGWRRAVRFANAHLSDDGTVAKMGHPGFVVIWLGVDAVEGAGEGDSFADVVEAADPGYGAFDAHAEAAVGDGAVFAEVEVPLEGGEG